MDKLDKRIIYWAIQQHNSTSYHDDEKIETILDELQSLRGTPLDTFLITDKIDRLQTECKVKQGKLVRCGNMLIPTNLHLWKGYTKVVSH